MEDFIVVMLGDEELKVFYEHAPREDDDEYVEIGRMVYKGIDVRDLLFYHSNEGMDFIIDEVLDQVRPAI
jgi:hypothetical protein